MSGCGARLERLEHSLRMTISCGHCSVHDELKVRCMDALTDLGLRSLRMTIAGDVSR